ncbi:helicase associated domain-containing protein [Streptomyces flaveolus]|uniref:helicase associated domain-containing protein n=1 Tax=Streptomyces flaveolus TaxID=67297 RepID=UPI00340AB012
MPLPPPASPCTPDTNPLGPGRRPVAPSTLQRLEPFLHVEGRAPTSCEVIRVDGDIVNLGAWLAKARTKHRIGQLPGDHARLVAALFDGDWTTETTTPVVLA